MSYSEMTDFEINHSVAQKVIDFEELVGVPMFGNSVRWGDGANWHHFNPCNSWADAGPIISKARISLIADGEWLAAGPGTGIDGYFDSKGGVGTYGGDLFWHDKNPLRAAMIVFLMMQGSK